MNLKEELVMQTVLSDISDHEKILKIKNIYSLKTYPKDYKILWDWLKTIKLNKWWRWTIYIIYNNARNAWYSARDILIWYKNYVKEATEWYLYEPRRFIWKLIFKDYIKDKGKEKWYMCEYWHIHKISEICNCNKI